MDIFYRKVAVSEEKPKSTGFYWIENIVGEMKSSYYDSMLGMFTGDYANFWLKPAENPTSQLQSDKNIGSFLTHDQKDHADKVFEFLKADNSTVLQQIEKSEADKEELLEVLEDCKERLEEMNKKLLKFTNYPHISVYFASKLNSIIKKHKK